MYKRQVKLQKFFCMLAIIASAAVFVYSLGLVTDLNDALRTAMPFESDIEETYVTGARIFYDIQPFNQALMLSGLGLLLLSFGLYITNTHVRRRYYIGNYCSTALWSIAAVVVSVWAHGQIEHFKTVFLTTVNFEELKEFAELFNGYYTESTFWFDLHYAIFGLVLLAVVILVANVVWKIFLMKQEADLLSGKLVVEGDGDDAIVSQDRLRFKRNKASANLTLVAIVLDMLYFVSIYQSDVGSYYYTYMIGVSVIYNLIFLLAAFLTEEAVKNYKKEYSYVQIALGAGQIVRIFILPLRAHITKLDGVVVMGDGQFMYQVALLILSGACLVGSAVVNHRKCTSLSAHMKMLAEQDSGRVSPSKVST